MNTEPGLGYEALTFICFVLSGFLCGILYELLRILGIRYADTKLKKTLSDVLTGVLIFTFLLLSFLKINNLDIKIQSFPGIILGISLYFFVFSAFLRHFLQVFLNFFEKILKILLYPAKISCIILKGLFVYVAKLSSGVRKFVFKFFARIHDNVKRFLKRIKKI